MQTVIDARARGAIDVEPAAVIVNDPRAYAIERARLAGIPSRVVAWDRTRESRALYDARLLDAVIETAPDLVLLLGWMHLLAPPFVARFPHIVNIHPAYLPLDPDSDTVVTPDGSTMPAFRGAHAIRDALTHGSPWYGVSIHRVTDEIDRGAILARRAAPLTAADEASALAALRPIEAETLLEALAHYGVHSEGR